MADVTIIMTKAGAQPTPPATLRSNLLTRVSAEVPDYTADLPGSLVEDIASTDVGALATIDAAWVDLINSISPTGANELLFTQLGNLAGIKRGGKAKTSVYSVFSGTVGYLIKKGFTVSDGFNQYTVQDGGIIATGGSSQPLYCEAIASGAWAVAPGTVTTISTSVPGTITLTCTNPTAGTPGTTDPESYESWRSRVLMAGATAGQGFPTYLKTRLYTVSGVQPRLVSLVQDSSGWKILCGGGDPYLVAREIYAAVPNLYSLVVSATPSRNISTAIIDYPDTYTVRHVNPPAQTVLVSVSWNTSAVNSISDDSVASLGKKALSDYVNSIYVGKPMNLFDMQDAFRNAVDSAIPKELITRMVFTVTIDGTVVSPVTGSGVISGDPEGYFFTDETKITIARG